MEKKIKVLIVLIIVLILLLLGLSGYMLYDKIIVNEEQPSNIGRNVNSNKNIKVPTNERQNSDSKELIDNILKDDIYNVIDKLLTNGLNEDVKMLIAISNTEPVTYTMKCSALFGLDENQEYRPKENDHWVCGGESGKIYLYDDVYNTYLKLFGNDNVLQKKGYYDIWAYEYSEIENAYVKLSPAFGPIISTEYIYDIESENYKDENLEINVRYLPYKWGMDDKYYIESDSVILSNLDEVKDYFNNNKSKMNIITFNFKKKNNDYILISIN